MKIFYNLTISLLSLILIGCTSTNMLVINVEKPAEVTLPSNIHSIAIVNNSVQQPKDAGHTAYLRGKKTEQEIQVSTDSVDIILMEGIYEKLAEKEYFDNVTLYPDLTRSDDDFTEIVELTPSRLIEISNSSHSDAVVAINKVTLMTKTDSKIYNEYDGTTLNTLDLDMYAIFRIYSTKGEPISPPFSITDSIYWVETSFGNEIVTDTLPSREDALKIGAAYLSQKISKVFTPSWINEPRLYYGDVKEAIAKLNENKWIEARLIWVEEFEKEDKIKRKARLANNIALTYELADEIKEATRWIQISCDLFSEEQVTSVDKDYLTRAQGYKDVLIDRVNDFRILDLRNK